MSLTIGSIPAIQTIQPLPVPPLAGAKSSPGAFQDILKSAINDVETFRTNAEAKVGQFLSGEGEELHQVVMATQKAELSFEMFQSVRNKVVQAYQEVMRMQL